MIRSVIRQMMVLALVPAQHVSPSFADLGQELTDVERLELFNLFEHFTGHWMRNVSTWTVSDISDRTNNYSEGYNNRFKKRLSEDVSEHTAVHSIDTERGGYYP